MPAAKKLIRFVVLFLLIGAIVSAFVYLKTSGHGKEILDDPSQLGGHFRHWVRHHRAIAPLTYVSLFIVLVVLMLPVWWIQILAGYCFGITMATLWGEVGSVLSALAAASVSRWLAADYFHRKAEAKLAKLRALDEKLGSNGLLVVIVVRLIHFMPVGISSYVFGISRITLADVGIGTLLGGLPVVLWWAALGAGVDPWKNWRVLTVLGIMHIVLLVPVGLRYWKPKWFQKYGIK